MEGAFPLPDASSSACLLGRMGPGLGRFRLPSDFTSFSELGVYVHFIDRETEVLRRSVTGIRGLRSSK